MKSTFYRLGEYKIIDSGTGALWWEAHAGLGALISGKCSIRGEILFIGPRESEEPGFLANEFLNQLERFPRWEKTKHYCLNHTIYECRSGRSLAKGEGGSGPIAESPRKGEGLSKRNDKLSEIFNLPFLKLRKVLRAIHDRAGTCAAPTKESIGAEKEKRDKGVKAKYSRETNAGKLDTSNWDTAIQWLGRKKWVGYIAVFILIMGFLFLAVLVGHWKKEEGHHKRDGHPSSHQST